jgi:hypothetical protein
MLAEMSKVKRALISLATSLAIFFAVAGVGLGYFYYHIFIHDYVPTPQSAQGILLPFTWPEELYKYFIDPDLPIPSSFRPYVLIFDLITYTLITYIVLTLLSRFKHTRSDALDSQLPPPPNKFM